MLFIPHYELQNKHALLSASKSSWVNYDDDKLDNFFTAHMASVRGTELHDLASKLIRLGVNLPDTTAHLNSYVNDAIGYRLTPEQPLYYSLNCFGTADAIGFRKEPYEGYDEEVNVLRISDLKTGITQVGFRQLEVYAAIFCLEYKFKPFDMVIELRIYQNNAVKIHIADPDTIAHIMDKIVTFDKRIMQRREEML